RVSCLFMLVIPRVSLSLSAQAATAPAGAANALDLPRRATSPVNPSPDSSSSNGARSGTATPLGLNSSVYVLDAASKRISHIQLRSAEVLPVVPSPVWAVVDTW